MNTEPYKVNNPLEELENPERINPDDIHNKIMVQWKKDFGSIHKDQTMDAYTVSGFVRNALKHPKERKLLNPSKESN